MIYGAPYAPLGQEKIKSMITLLQIKPGERAVDLGAGDGRIIIALAKHGAITHGYEMNPLLVLLGKRNIQRANLNGNAHMHWGDMWRAELETFDIVTIYLTAHIMQRVEQKLRKETRPGTKIVVNYFQLPKWKSIKQKNTLYLYEKTPTDKKQ